MPEQDPSRFEAFKQGAKDKLAIGLMTAAGIVGGAVIASQAETEPAFAAGPNPEATASDLQQDCVTAGLNVDVLKSEMFRPGDPKSQSIISRASLQPTSEECLQLGISRENPTVSFQIENPKKPGKFFTIGKPQGLKGSKGPLGNQGGTGEAYIAPVFAIKNPRYRYRCTPGKGVTDVRAIYHTQVDGPDGNKLAEKDRTVRVRVRPVRGPLEHKGAVRRAC